LISSGNRYGGRSEQRRGDQPDEIHVTRLFGRS
jgi:hypothetical protein